MARVVVYTAPGCHLCGPALDAVESVCGRGFEVVDITANGELERRYRSRIPVVEVDGRDRMVDIYRELNPSFVLTHALEDPYNFDHPNAAHFAQETRVVAQAMGHKPGAKYTYSAPPVFLFEPHQPEMCNFKPQVILNIDEVWEIKRKTFEILAAQKHLWAYYERVALQRGVQGGRNTGKPMTYGEAYQRLFPMAMEELA